MLGHHWDLKYMVRYSQGETIEATMKNIKEAIEAHLLALKEEKEEVPVREEFVIGRVKVEASAAG